MPIFIGVKRLTEEQIKALRAVPVTASMRNRLRIAMALTDSTQNDVAEGTSLTQATISDIYNGKYADLKHSTVQAIASHFGVLIEDIFPTRLEVAS
jgi:DNA-binding XRE family transcriptional regulator